MPAKLASSGLNLVHRSLVVHAGMEFGLVQTPGGSRLAVLAPAESTARRAFEGERSEFEGQALLVGELNPQNAAALRAQLPWLQPQPLGLRTSFGMGDRLGLATPGHVRAVRAVGGGFGPLFAQQSIREMERTARTPQQVMDDATWGLFAEGWRGAVGADADHLQTTADIDACLAAGFTLFTIDPGSFVDNRAATAGLSELRELAEMLPVDLQPHASDLLGKTLRVEGLEMQFDEATLLRAAVKYGRATVNVAGLYHHLVHAAGPQPHELEVSIDETEQPTSHAEHAYMASELRRLGVQWVSLAPRYVGRFEKGVDYIGDVATFESDLAGHAAIARELGPYKLSIHSGSDKFSIYPAAMRQTRGLLHVKTAGTSYLEALRTVASLDKAFFAELYAFARERYPVDRATYHISADLARAPLPEAVTDWPRLLNQFDARQILHVTFGSIVTERDSRGRPRFYDRLVELLRAHSETYAAHLRQHFERHLRSFLSEA